MRVHPAALQSVLGLAAAAGTKARPASYAMTCQHAKLATLQSQDPAGGTPARFLRCIGCCWCLHAYLPPPCTLPVLTGCRQPRLTCWRVEGCNSQADDRAAPAGQQTGRVLASVLSQTEGQGRQGQGRPALLLLWAGKAALPPQKAVLPFGDRHAARWPRSAVHQRRAQQRMARKPVARCQKAPTRLPVRSASPVPSYICLLAPPSAAHLLGG